MDQIYDIAVIGGGINGAGIARDAAGRGLKVALVEAEDLASATSSASSKIIHGGLRYLEHYEFRLVREALKERETLIRNTPHIIWPLEFILPHQKHLRPSWLIRIGLFIYDHLAKRVILPASRSIDLTDTPQGEPLKDEISFGFSYYDGWVQDSRLVVLNAVDAKERGADIHTRTKCLSVAEDKEKKHWVLRCEGKVSQLRTKAVINAAGPWVDDIIQSHKKEAPRRLKLVKGSHIVVKKMFEGDHAYILQNADGRIVFVFSYENDFSFIGTTDVIYDGNPREVKISDEETKYLCDIVNDYFKKQISPSDVIESYAGVRALLEDGKEQAQKVTRDYKLELNKNSDLPFLNILGGKITTYRKLSENAVEAMRPYFPEMKEKWTSDKPLPGGDILNADFEQFVDKLYADFPWLSDTLLFRYARAYGTRTYKILENVNTHEDMGQHFGEDVYETEIRYMMQHEFAENLEDVLWRRSKLRLHISDKTRNALEDFLKENKT